MARPKRRGPLKPLNLNIDKEISDRLNEISEKTGVSKTSIVEKALRDYMNSLKKEFKALE